MISETLRDIKGPLSLSSRLPIPLLVGTLLFLVVLVLLFMNLTRKRRALAPVPKRRAHEIAYEQLEKLKAKDLIRQAKVKEYYSEVSDIVRHYLENRFLLKAPEMTTEEFLFYVRDYSPLISEHKTLLKEFLLACDLVKFARHVPPSEEMSAIIVSAEKLVDETKEELSVK